LTFIQRLPKNEVFKAHGAAVMELSVKLLRAENEENALLCIKIMIDAFRNQRVSQALGIGLHQGSSRTLRSAISGLRQNHVCQFTRSD
jgi:hypothetical protein